MAPQTLKPQLCPLAPVPRLVKAMFGLWGLKPGATINTKSLLALTEPMADQKVMPAHKIREELGWAPRAALEVAMAEIKKEFVDSRPKPPAIADQVDAEGAAGKAVKA